MNYVGMGTQYETIGEEDYGFQRVNEEIGSRFRDKELVERRSVEESENPSNGSKRLLAALGHLS